MESSVLSPYTLLGTFFVSFVLVVILVGYGLHCRDHDKDMGRFFIIILLLSEITLVLSMMNLIPMMTLHT